MYDIKIGCLMMQRDEVDLLEPWILYHAKLFGMNNLYIWDNGSHAPQVIETLSVYKKKGVNVCYQHNTPLDFRRKGVILGERIKILDAMDKYDYFIPLDCDEFFALKVNSNEVSFDSSVILDDLANLNDEVRPLGVTSAFYNILGHKGHFWEWPHKKTFFRAKTFKQMDHGFHEGVSVTTSDRRETRIVYMHYHHKPHAILVEHSKNKVAPYFDITNPVELANLYDKNRLVRFMLDSEENYMRKFSKHNAIFIPQFENYLCSIGAEIPF